jgi:serine/threonine protein phosphatase PrpC
MSEKHANVFVEGQMTEAVLVDCGEGRAAVFTSSPAYPDKTNQDAAAVIAGGRDRFVLAVADGAGGLPLGHRAAALVVGALAGAMESTDHDEARLRTAVLDGLEHANRSVRELGVGAASTAAVAQVQGRVLRTYHVGDSSILVVGQRGKVKLVTMSHSPVGYQVEAGTLPREDALHHEDLNVVSNFVGDEDMRIEIGPSLTLGARDTVVVASDGLFDNLHLEEIVEVVRAGPIEVAAARLAAACTERMLRPTEGLPSKPDDLTFIVYRGIRAASRPRTGSGAPATRAPPSE